MKKTGIILNIISFILVISLMNIYQFNKGIEETEDWIFLAIINVIFGYFLIREFYNLIFSKLYFSLGKVVFTIGGNVIIILLFLSVGAIGIFKKEPIFENFGILMGFCLLLLELGRIKKYILFGNNKLILNLSDKLKNIKYSKISDISIDENNYRLKLYLSDEIINIDLVDAKDIDKVNLTKFLTEFEKINLKTE